MLPQIRFDINAMHSDFKNHLKKVINQLAIEITSEIKSGLKWNKSDVKLEEVEEIEGHIMARIESNAYAIIESYGTGTNMDKNNPALDDYMFGELWNPARWGYAIQGRPAGTYVNIFGEEVTSKGGRELYTLNDGIKPSYIIQNIEKRYFNTDIITTRLNKEINEWLKANSSKYFTFS